MPIYEFRCKKCNHVFEYLCLSMNDRDQACCPSCGHKETEALLSTFSSTGSRDSGKGTSSLSSCSNSGGFS
ncbi:MAG: zinc ribbon domain-containing protein [Thermodesulfobacteriota bacterium]|nr:zinc ribbon domain-containing protein [Thermodesulfobacteriota bacterium]